jgi:hypothetical protein
MIKFNIIFVKELKNMMLMSMLNSFDIFLKNFQDASNDTKLRYNIFISTCESFEKCIFLH